MFDMLSVLALEALARELDRAMSEEEVDRLLALVSQVDNARIIGKLVYIKHIAERNTDNEFRNFGTSTRRAMRDAGYTPFDDEWRRVTQRLAGM